MLVSLRPLAEPLAQEVKHREHNTNAFLNHNHNTPLGNGTLIIAENCLSWMTDNGQGFELEYPMISLHAISRDLTNFHSECLYLMVEDKDCSDTESADESDSRHNEIRFVPEDKSHLELMFKAMSECQALHPDPNDSISEEDDEDEEDDVYEDADLEATDSSLMRGNVYDVAAAEDSRGLPTNQTDDSFANGDSEEPMEVMGQFDDAEADH